MTAKYYTSEAWTLFPHLVKNGAIEMLLLERIQIYILCFSPPFWSRLGHMSALLRGAGPI